MSRPSLPKRPSTTRPLRVGAGRWIDVKGPRIELTQDHVLITLTGWAAALHVRRSIIVPYSTVASADARDPVWPGLTEGWRIGAHVPGFVARGTFTTWKGRRRFYALDHSTSRVVRLQLVGHPEFDELTLEAPDADGLVAQIERKSKHA